jgi:hypothetical protein
MPRTTATLFAALMLPLLAAPSASAATPTDRKVAALARQVAALQKQVKTLNKRVRTLEVYSISPFLGSTCQAALTADLFQSTWAVIDQVAGRTIFGPQTQVNDFGNCAFLRSPAVPRPALQVPPSITLLNPIIDWLHVNVS